MSGQELLENLDKAAQRWLVDGQQQCNPEIPALVQLVLRGFETNVPLPGPQGEFRMDLEIAAARLTNPRLDRAKVLRWFVQNPNGPDENEQALDLLNRLLQAQGWEVAAQEVMETFSARLAAENDHYQPYRRQQP